MKLTNPEKMVTLKIVVLTLLLLLIIFAMFLFVGCAKDPKKGYTPWNDEKKPTRLEKVADKISNLQLWEQTRISSGWSSIVVIRVPSGWVVTDNDKWGCFVPEPKETGK